MVLTIHNKICNLLLGDVLHINAQLGRIQQKEEFMKIVSIEKPLKLKNDGELEIVFLGVGSASAKTLNQTNFLIIKGTEHILVDFGMTGPKALLETTGLEPMDIEVMLPTHSHADHIGGIESLALLNRYVGRKFMGKQKIVMIINRDYQRVLWENSLRGGLEYNEEEQATKKALSFGDYFTVVRPEWKAHQPREIFQVKFGDIKLEIFQTNHIPDSSTNWEGGFNSYGLLIDDRIFVSGDTKFDPKLIEMYKDRSEVMFHDCQFFTGGVHSSLEELKTLPDDARNKMFLLHYSDDWEKKNIEAIQSNFRWTKQGVRYMF